MTSTAAIGTTSPETLDTPQSDAAVDTPEGTEAEAEKPTIPEKYDATLPDGVEIDQAALGSFEPIARELGLSQEQFSKVLGWYQGEFMTTVAQASAERALEELKGHQTYGGPNLRSTVEANDVAVRHLHSVLPKADFDALYETLASPIGNMWQTSALLGVIASLVKEPRPTPPGEPGGVPKGKPALAEALGYADKY